VTALAWAAAAAVLVVGLAGPAAARPDLPSPGPTGPGVPTRVNGGPICVTVSVPGVTTVSLPCLP